MNIITFTQKIAQSKSFEYTIIGLILLTSVLLGIEGFPSILSPKLSNFLNRAHEVILIAFIIEAIIKILACSPQPQNYFKNGWNTFDFSLVVLSLLPISSSYVMLGRVLRLLRVLRLINAIPELRIIVETLVKSIPSMFHITLLMSILFFIYAVLGFHLFHQHDPEHWRNLAYSLLTLFRIVTLEDWTDVMYTAMELSPFYAIYFVSFVVCGTFVVINLFIAVVINNLDEAKYTHLKKLSEPDLHDQLIETVVNTKSSLEKIERKLKVLQENQNDKDNDA